MAPRLKIFIPTNFERLPPKCWPLTKLGIARVCPLLLISTFRHPSHFRLVSMYQKVGPHRKLFFLFLKHCHYVFPFIGCTRFLSTWGSKKINLQKWFYSSIASGISVVSSINSKTHTQTHTNKKKKGIYPKMVGLVEYVNIHLCGLYVFTTIWLSDWGKFRPPFRFNERRLGDRPFDPPPFVYRLQ